MRAAGQSETIEAVNFDGSGALKVTYQNYERNTVVGRACSASERHG